MTGSVYSKLVLLISLTAFLLVYHTTCKYHVINGNRVTGTSQGQMSLPHKEYRLGNVYKLLKDLWIIAYNYPNVASRLV